MRQRRMTKTEMEAYAIGFTLYDVIYDYGIPPKCLHVRLEKKYTDLVRYELWIHTNNNFVTLEVKTGAYLKRATIPRRKFMHDPQAHLDAHTPNMILRLMWKD